MKNAEGLLHQITGSVDKSHKMSRSLHIVLITVFYFGMGEAVPCRQDWIQFEESCYGYGEQLVSWEDAGEVCRSAGGMLAEIETSEENEFLKSQACLKGGAYWVGASDIFGEGHWTWMSTGASLDLFSDWYTGRPNDLQHNQDCVLLQPGFDYQWDDRDCLETYNFVCETGLEEPVVG